jgi:hypothetical protein
MTGAVLSSASESPDNNNVQGTESKLLASIIAGLPDDKFVLKQKERNLVALLAKDRGKLRAAKDVAKKQELTVKIQQAELVLEAMRSRLRG